MKLKNTPCALLRRSLISSVPPASVVTVAPMYLKEASSVLREQQRDFLSVLFCRANLSADYFTNRQDRYIEIENCPRLANYFHGLVSTVRCFSLDLQPDNTTRLDENFPSHPTEGFDGGERFKMEAGKRISNYLRQQKEENVFNNAPEQYDTWVVPLVQMFPFGIRQDEFITSELLSSLCRGSKVFLASGYFNLTRKYIDIMLKSSAQCEILTAHPTVNGFYKAKGLAGKTHQGSYFDTMLMYRRRKT